MSDVYYFKEETGDQEPVNSTTESPVENQQEIVENENVNVEEEHEEEEEEEEDNENEDVQSFVTAQDNDHDQLLESVNDLHLGHDNDGNNDLHSRVMFFCT